MSDLPRPTDDELEAMANDLVWFPSAAAMLRACKGRFRVKALSWGRAEKSGMNLQADCPFGRYYIALRGEHGWMWWRPASDPSHMGIEPSEEAAKAAAQADYEARILAALDSAPDQGECIHPFCGEKCGEPAEKGPHDD